MQSVGWQTAGSLLATQCKDKMLRVVDPRSSDAALQCDSHQGAKDSKVVWLSDCQRVLTTGFGSVSKQKQNVSFPNARDVKIC